MGMKHGLVAPLSEFLDRLPKLGKLQQSQLSL